MDTATEIWTAALIEAKIMAGKELTEREQRIWAYSPYGAAGGCHACATAHPTEVTQLIERQSEN